MAVFIPQNEAEMEALGAAVAQQVKAPAIIYLDGNLGAGKTTFSRGFLRGLGHAGAVKSPTYTLVEPYEIAGKHCFHFDLYRLSEPEELEAMGIRDYLHEHAVCLIEWPERGEGVLPDPDLAVEIKILKAGREVRFETQDLVLEAALGSLEI